MYEVEVKVAADHDAVRAALPGDAEALGVLEQVDTYYDAPHRDFAETDEALRLRREREVDVGSDADAESTVADSEPDASLDVGSAATGDVGPQPDFVADSNASAEGDGWSTELTYKGPLVDEGSKTREEFESPVADGEAVGEALERLGFEPAATVRKVRERHAVGEFTVTLDDVAGLGEFVEVETECEREADVAEARDAARSLLADLGCDPDEHLRTSYLGLLLAEE